MLVSHREKDTSSFPALLTCWAGALHFLGCEGSLCFLAAQVPGAEPLPESESRSESLQALLAVGCLLKPHAWGGPLLPTSHAEGFLLPTCPPEVNFSLGTQQHRLHPVSACFFFLLHHQWGLATHSMDSQSAWDFGG